MNLPDFKTFSQLARGATLVPVTRTISADLLTPVSAFLALAEREPYSFLLESVEGGERIGRYTFLGIRPYMVVSGRGDHVTVRRGKRVETQKANLLSTLRVALREHKPVHVPGLPPFTAGAVGYFAYDAVRHFERLPSKAKDDLQLPDGVFMFYDRLLAFDHLRHQLHIIAAADLRNEKPRAAYERAIADIDTLEKKLVSGLRIRRLSPEHKAAKIKLHARTKPEDFLKGVRTAKEYISAGDIFQVVLSQRLDFPLPADPFDIYRSLRTVNPSPYMYFLRMDDLHVLGSSPEMLVKVSNRALEYRPIAGTYKRGATPEEDAQLEEHLRTNEKERAEHVMLVDLGRNDLGRVSEYGSVKVKDLMYVERYSHVMHLVSALEGKLRGDLDALDAFAACFPAGTLSGAPKVRAMEIIEELEPTRRGVYGGSVLYADFAGNLDSCIAIRTMVVKNNRAYVQAGAGIVADSDPQSEFQECRNKAQAVVRAAELAGR
jgi:anthranilate synthase component I